MDVTIAPTAPEHVQGLHRVLDITARERKYFGVFEAAPLPKVREHVANMLERGNPYFIALAADEVVGYCEIERVNFPANAHAGILEIGILPTFRDRGLGFRLISSVLAEARRAGFVRVALGVHADNARAIALYEKVGFVREGVLRDAVLIDGKYLDAILMALVDQGNALRR